jgi:PAS domain S-box-containing protein
MLAHEPLFDAILTLCQDAIVVAAADGRIAAWNDAAERLYGYASEEAIGRPIVVMLSAQALEPGERLAAVHLRKDGRSVEVELSAVRLDDGGALVVVRDLAERTRARQRNEALVRVGRRCALESDADRLLQALLEEAVAALRAHAGAVFRWDDGDGGLVVVGRFGERVPAFPLVRPGEGVLGDAVRHQRTLVVNDYAGVANQLPAAVAAGVTAVAAVPLTHEARPLGALWLGCYDGTARFESDAAETLEQMAGVAAAALAGLVAARLDGVLLAARTAEHEVNNRLVATCAYAQYMLRDPALPEHLRDKADAAARGGKEAAAILRMLRDLAEIRETRWGPDPDLTTIDLKTSRRRPG